MSDFVSEVRVRGGRGGAVELLSCFEQVACKSCASGNCHAEE